LFQTKYSKYRSLKYRFFLVSTHDNLAVSFRFFALTDFSSIPRSSSFPSVGRVKRKAPLALSMDANEAPLAGGF